MRCAPVYGAPQTVPALFLDPAAASSDYSTWTLCTAPPPKWHPQPKQQVRGAWRGGLHTPTPARFREEIRCLHTPHSCRPAGFTRPTATPGAIQGDERGVFSPVTHISLTQSCSPAHTILGSPGPNLGNPQGDHFEIWQTHFLRNEALDTPRGTGCNRQAPWGTRCSVPHFLGQRPLVILSPCRNEGFAGNFPQRYCPSLLPIPVSTACPVSP